MNQKSNISTDAEGPFQVRKSGRPGIQVAPDKLAQTIQQIRRSSAALQSHQQMLFGQSMWIKHAIKEQSQSPQPHASSAATSASF